MTDRAFCLKIWGIYVYFTPTGRDGTRHIFIGDSIHIIWNKFRNEVYTYVR